MIIIIDPEFCLSALVSEWVPHVEHKAVMKLLIGNIKSCIAGVHSCGEITILHGIGLMQGLSVCAGK